MGPFGANAGHAMRDNHNLRASAEWQALAAFRQRESDDASRLGRPVRERYTMPETFRLEAWRKVRTTKILKGDGSWV